MISFHNVGGVIVREEKLEAGQEVQKHVHDYDHLSYLATGRALVEIDGVLGIVQGPAPLEVKAGKTHRIQAITDITWLCIHSEAIADPETLNRE
jgi:quercetin dioxygenase-like cupin family protein